ncbi:helix-turn-helix domain-containing protein [Cohnella sp. GbtcB17]|uniref:helix-turn-helix domain-containing protein n=1 Tax=Cohnella sp. GbtcB17 TaxID=2824762 RepID=UPI001C300987|nr:helix-turn-helix domain-containing protein [Cohnella sp. GbtcB17]
MSFLKKRRRHATLTRLILSYLLVLVIPLLIGSYVYKETVQLAQEEALRSNQSLLEQTGAIVDERLNELDAISKYIAMDRKIISLMNVEEIAEGSNDYYKVWDILSTNPKYNLTNKFIVDYYVFFKDNRLVLSSDRSYTSPEAFEKSLYRNQDSGSPDWDRVLWSERHQSQYVSGGHVTIDGKSHRVIYYLQSIPWEYSSNPKGALMILIDESAIQNLLSKINLGRSGMIFVENQDGDIITQLTGDRTVIEPSGIAAGNLRDGNYVSPAGEKFIVSRSLSTVSGWKYVSVVPSRLVMTKVDYIRNVTFAVLLITLTLGIVTACMLAYRNYKPVKQLVGKIRELFGTDNDRSMSEYDYLDSRISELYRSHRSMRDQMLRTTFFERLLNGGFYDQGEDSLPVHVEGERFGVMLARIMPGKDTSDRRTAEQMNRLMLLVKEELCTEAAVPFYKDDLNDNRIVIVVSFGEGDPSSMRSIVERFEEKVRDKLPFDVHFSAGAVYPGLHNVSISFDEAKQALEYARYAKNGSAYTLFSEVPNENQKFYYPIELELKLISNVKSGDEAEVRRIIRRISEENFVNRSLTSGMIEQLIHVLKGTVVRSLGPNEMEPQIGRLLEKVQRMDRIEDIFEAILASHLLLCHAQAEQKNQDKAKLKAQIAAIVEQSYMREDFVLYELASQLRFSETYMYQLFKELMNATFSDYLEGTRIRRACELLNGEECTIRDVAKAVGYSSDHTFRRAFKRIMGVAPTEYVRATRGLEGTSTT